MVLQPMVPLAVGTINNTLLNTNKLWRLADSWLIDEPNIIAIELLMIVFHDSIAAPMAI